jgi:hypothetical protein
VLNSTASSDDILTELRIRFDKMQIQVDRLD